jgi:inorganic pyrophosphatase
MTTREIERLTEFAEYLTSSLKKTANKYKKSKKKKETEIYHALNLYVHSIDGMLDFYINTKKRKEYDT